MPLTFALSDENESLASQSLERLMTDTSPTVAEAPSAQELWRGRSDAIASHPHDVGTGMTSGSMTR